MHFTIIEMKSAVNKSNQRQPVISHDKPEDECDDIDDYEEDETDSDDSSSVSYGDRAKVHSSARQSSRSQDNTKRKPYQKESVVWNDGADDDGDCGGFDIIFTPVQYIQTLFNSGCDDDTVVIENTSSSASSSNSPPVGYEAGKSVRSNQRQLGQKSTKGKQPRHISSSSVDIADDLFYEIDSRQKKSPDSINVKSARSRSPIDPTYQPNHGNINSALNKSSVRQSQNDHSPDYIEDLFSRDKPLAANNPIQAKTTAETEASAFNIDSFLEEISSIGMILSWHKHITESSTKFGLPTTVRSFIEISDALQSTTTTTTWEPYFLLEELDTTGEYLQPLERRRICLFDIVSITRPAASALKAFPLACKIHCFLLTLSDGEILLLEAQTEPDVKRIVLGLRWTIAKLSFNVVIGNPDMCEELLPLRRIKYSVKPVIVDSAELDAIMKSVTHRLLESYQM